MERCCGLFDNKHEYGFILFVVLFMGVLFYRDSARPQVAINERHHKCHNKNKRQVNTHGVDVNNHKNKKKQGYRSPRERGLWRKSSIALFGRSLDEWNNCATDVILVSHGSAEALSEQKA